VSHDLKMTVPDQSEVPTRGQTGPHGHESSNIGGIRSRYDYVYFRCRFRAFEVRIYSYTVLALI
jgi:hypothetical protein